MTDSAIIPTSPAHRWKVVAEKAHSRGNDYNRWERAYFQFGTCQIGTWGGSWAL